MPFMLESLEHSSSSWSSAEEADRTYGPASSVSCLLKPRLWLHLRLCSSYLKILDSIKGSASACYPICLSFESSPWKPCVPCCTSQAAGVEIQQVERFPLLPAPPLTLPVPEIRLDLTAF